MIAEADLDGIVSQIEAEGLSEDMVMGLRSSWPGLHFTYCSDDDICGPKPVRESEKFNLYLVDATEHCLRMTNNPEVATGIVLAEIEADF